MTTLGSYTPTELDTLANTLIDRLLTLSVNWQLTRAELAQLVGTDEAKLQALIDTPALIVQAIREEDTGTWLPIAELIQIESLLDVLITNQDHLNAWIKTPNTAPLFGGATALEFLLRDPVKNRALVIGYLWGVCNCDFS